MNDVFDLDLDVLKPEPKRVKLGDKVFNVYPPTLDGFIALSRLAKKMKDADQEDYQKFLEEIRTLLESIVPEDMKPQLKELQLMQMVKLLMFMIELGKPKEEEMYQAAGVHPAKDGEKKTSDLANSLPTSSDSTGDTPGTPSDVSV